MAGPETDPQTIIDIADHDPRLLLKAAYLVIQELRLAEDLNPEPPMEFVPIDYDEMFMASFEGYNYSLSLGLTIVATAFVTPDSDEDGDFLYLNSLAVRQGMQRQGYGSLLLRHIAHRNAIEPQRIVAIPARDSVGFYRKLGFAFGDDYATITTDKLLQSGVRGPQAGNQ